MNNSNEALKTKTVLYIEDNPANMELVRQILFQRPEVEMLGATHAREGLELAKTRCPDLILMDINLPGMDGLTALDLLKSDASTESIPVLALSANVMKSDIEKGIKSGFKEYITKPLKIVDFLDTVDRFLLQAPSN